MLVIKSFIHRFTIICLSASALAAHTVMPALAQGDDMMLTSLSGQSNAALGSLVPGDQAYGSALNGSARYAGQALSFENASALLGMSSDVAYFLVLDGRVMVGGKKAKRGRVIVLQPYGVKPEIKRFDAARLLSSLDDTAINNAPKLKSQLQKIAGKQGTQKWWGYVRPTNVNLNAPKGTEIEEAKRQLTSNDTMRDLRFSDATDETAAAKSVVETFLKALRSGDSAAVSALLDPTQFGGLDLRGGGNGAREMAAKMLIQAHSPSSNTATPSGDISRWRIETTRGARNVTLRRVDDLFFIQTVS